MNMVRTIESAHAHIGQFIDRVFPPVVEADEIVTWDKLWRQRLLSAARTGQVYEHDHTGKRWLYERVVDCVERSVGGSLAGKTVAEFGCGSGYASLRMIERGARVVLIDGSASALEYAAWIAHRLGVKREVTFHRADLSGPSDFGPFDVSFQSGVLEHYDLDAATAMLRGMARETRVGGTVIVMLPNLLAPVLMGRMMSSRSKGSERFYTPWLLRRVFDRAGLPDSRAGYVNALLPVSAPLALLRASERLHVASWAGPLSALFFRSAELRKAAVAYD